jgi:hypothetical protein
MDFAWMSSPQLSVLAEDAVPTESVSELLEEEEDVEEEAVSPVEESDLPPPSKVLKYRGEQYVIDYC